MALSTLLAACGGESSSELPTIEAGLDADAAPPSSQEHDAGPRADDVSSPRADSAMATDASFERAIPEAGIDAAPLIDVRNDSASTPDARADSGPSVDASTEAGTDRGPRDAAAGCAVAVTAPVGPKAARSSGYSGTYADYSMLYNVPCTGLAQCSAACELAGGTAASCAAASECIVSSPNYCLPPTYWSSTELALMEDSDGNSSAVLTLVKIGYNDPLVVSNFSISIPSGATIRGIQFDVRRNALDEQAVDDSVHILKNGVPVGPDRSKSALWPAELAYASYGGPSDTWGQTWTAADLQATGFGLAIAARYTETAGNSRAYVDFVRAQVYYTPAGCE